MKKKLVCFILFFVVVSASAFGQAMETFASCSSLRTHFASTSSSVLQIDIYKKSTLKTPINKHKYIAQAKVYSSQKAPTVTPSGSDFISYYFSEKNKTMPTYVCSPKSLLQTYSFSSSTNDSILLKFILPNRTVCGCGYDYEDMSIFCEDITNVDKI